MYGYKTTVVTDVATYSFINTFCVLKRKTLLSVYTIYISIVLVYFVPIYILLKYFLNMDFIFIEIFGTLGRLWKSLNILINNDKKIPFDLGYSYVI